MYCIVCGNKANAKCCSVRCLALARKSGKLKGFPRRISDIVLDSKLTHPKYLIKSADINKYTLIGKEWVNSSSLWQHFMYICSLDKSELQTECYCGKPIRYAIWNPDKIKYCSAKCAANSTTTIKRRIETNVSRHGVQNISQLSSVKAKKVATCLSNHGVKYPQQSKIVRSKTIDSLQERFGVDNVSRSEQCKVNRTRTMIELYGADNYRKSEAFKKQYVQKSIERFGTIHPMLNNEVKLRCVESSKTIGPEGHKPTTARIVDIEGKVFKLRGFEDAGLRWLLDNYSINQISNSNKNMPKFMYKERGVQRRYFPDFFIKEGDGSLTVVEVKSTFTLGTRSGSYSMFKNLIKKAKSVHKKGYKFIVLVFNSRKNLAFSSTSFHKARKSHFIAFRNCELQHGRLDVNLL